VSGGQRAVGSERWAVSSGRWAGIRRQEAAGKAGNLYHAEGVRFNSRGQRPRNVAIKEIKNRAEARCLLAGGYDAESASVFS
jgi:hypothetical protein